SLARRKREGFIMLGIGCRTLLNALLAMLALSTVGWGSDAQATVCSFTLTPNSVNLAASGTGGYFKVSASSEPCPYTATWAAPWVQVYPSLPSDPLGENV